MFVRFHKLTIPLAITAATLLIADLAQAQCSGGRRSGGASQATALTGSSNSFVPTQSQREIAYQQQMFAMRAQMMAQQQQLYAMRQQQMQQLAQQRYGQQQDRRTALMARAEANRAKRAERLAATIAKRQADQSERETDSVLASTDTASTFVSAKTEKSFD